MRWLGRAHAGVVCPGPTWPARATQPDVGAAVLIGLVALALFVSVEPYHPAVQPTRSDEPQYLLLTQGLQLDGDLDLANDYAGQR